MAHAARRSALITGAAGNVGSRIVDHLAQQQKSLIGLYRNKLPTSHKNVLPLCCDLLTPEAIVAPLKSTDTVIHLAWQGGILGSLTGRTADGATSEPEHSPNVEMTKNLIKAMERAGSRKIILLSWVGVDKRSTTAMLREKYWVENAVINSSIPEKFIIRAGLISGCNNNSEFLKAAAPVSKWPLFLPLPRRARDLVLTTVDDVLWAIDEALKVEGRSENFCRVVDLASTAPMSGAEIISAVDTKMRGKQRLTLGGFLGDVLFRWSEKKFGTAKSHEPRLQDFFAATTLAGTKVPFEGVPPTSTSLSIGHKVDIMQAL